jgi:Gas vesicle synthesis protein GvpL/GvpF
VIQLYAITDHPGPPLRGPETLRTVAQDGLAAVCAPAAEGAELSAELLWRHEEVVEALMEDRDLLPVRYGTRLDDEGAVARALAERHRELARALDRVRGAVELSVRVLGEQEAGPPAEEAASGAEYMRAKARAAAAHDGVVRAVHEPLSRLARASMQRPPRASGELLRSAYLVERGDVDGFVTEVGVLQDARPALRLLCTGPWPPYSFSEP